MDEIINWIKQWTLGNTHQKIKGESNFLIRTLDNPGWKVFINMEGTALEGKTLAFNNIERSEDDWIFCFVNENIFKAFCGPENLIEALLVFINWFNKENQLQNQKLSNLSILEWLQKWYLRNCDGDWEHMFGVSIKITNAPGWKVWIDLEETELEDKNLMANCIKKTECDWLEYKIDRERYQVLLGTCSLKNLNELLEIFKNWVNANL